MAFSRTSIQNKKSTCGMLIQLSHFIIFSSILNSKTLNSPSISEIKSLHLTTMRHVRLIERKTFKLNICG